MILTEIYQDREIKLLVNGYNAFPRIINRIKNAQKSIYINMFIWRDDKIGNMIANELLYAANRGVKVVIVKDKLGEVFEKAEETKQSFWHKEFNLSIFIRSWIADKIYPMIGKATSSVQRKNITAEEIANHDNVEIQKVIRSDHSKYYIFDDETIITGGMNIEDKSIYTDVEGKEYIDYMIEINDPSIVDYFKSKVLGDGKFEEKSNVDFIFNIIKGNKREFNIKENLLKLLLNSNKSISFIMAYWGDMDIANKIIELSLKGVEINILLPEKSNVQHDLNMKMMRYLMEKSNNNINVFLSKNMVHSKLIFIDKKILTFGSSNLNNGAMKKLQELNVVIDCDDVLKKDLMESLKNNFKTGNKINDYREIKYNRIKAYFESLV